MTYHGIPISEFKLLFLTILFTVLFLAVVTAMGFLGYQLWASKQPSHNKSKARLRRLREKASTDEIAQKQLAKMERKQQRRKQRNRKEFAADIVILAIGFGITCALLFTQVIPGWTDYVQKDYAVYTGGFEIIQMGKHHGIELPDGTALTGIGDFDYDDTYGTVVYAKRSKITLGSQS